MKVVLLKELEGYGSIGSVINVKDGFARNYLIPRGIALPATESNLKHVNSIITQKLRKLQKEKERALDLAKKIEGLILEIKHPVGEKGKLYGSVTSSEISKALSEKGFEIDKKRIVVNRPIRDVGIHTVQIRLHPEVEVQIKVDVQPQK